MLKTDLLNAAEIRRHSLERALAHYDTARERGEPRNVARQEAVTYLRRKTNWTHPYACGAFDSALANRSKNT